MDKCQSQAQPVGAGGGSVPPAPGAAGKGGPASRRCLAPRRVGPGFGESSGGAGGTEELLTRQGSARSQDLRPAPRRSRGEAPSPGARGSEQGAWKGRGIPLARGAAACPCGAAKAPQGGLQRYLRQGCRARGRPRVGRRGVWAGAGGCSFWVARSLSLWHPSGWRSSPSGTGRNKPWFRDADWNALRARSPSGGKSHPLTGKAMREAAGRTHTVEAAV